MKSLFVQHNTSQDSRRYLIGGAILLLVVLVSACGSAQPDSAEVPSAGAVPSETTIPTVQPLPDLVITSGRMTIDGYTGGCTAGSDRMATEVCVRNQGQGDAGPFTLRVLHRQGGGQFSLLFRELEAGEEFCQEVEGRTTGRVTVDVDDEVMETDEDNNNFIIPLPTPPPACTPTATPTQTPTPLPYRAPSATPFPEGSKVTTEVFPVYFCEYTGQVTGLGRGVFEWYRVEVTTVNGEILSEEIVRGPYRGTWQGGCPDDPTGNED